MELDSSSTIHSSKRHGNSADRTNARKKLAFLICGSLDSLTGGYIYDKKMVEYLRDVRGYDVDVLSIPLGTSRWFSIFRDVWSAIRLLRRNCDLIVEDGMIYRSVAIVNSLLCRRTPLLGIIHMIDWRACRSNMSARISRVLERRMISPLSCIVVNSKDTRAQVRSLLGPATRGDQMLSLIYPGYDSPTTFSDNKDDQAFQGQAASRTGYSQAEEDDSSQVRILYAGQIIPRKGLHLLIEALAMLSSDNWTLYVAGDDACDPAYTRNMIELIKRYRLSDRIRMMGEVDRSKMRHLMASSDVFVLPTMYEAFGMSILEAQALGVPAVAFSVGGVKEVITDGVTGVLIPPFDVEELSSALNRLLCDSSYRRQLATSALKLKTKEFSSWEECCERFASCVDHIQSLKEAKPD
ncbi:MAG TPA: glycosyltransferase family 4 protein [Nitrososphaerales archaeon]|nr:glycosyltransferase family 4 protein [Nitrososphaerales archaeon]